MINEISTALLPILQAITLDGDTLFETENVIAHPPTDDQGTDFTGFPAAAYFYDGTDSDYSTVTQNRRDFHFDIWVYGIWQAKPLAEQYNIMYGYLDALLDALDKSGDLGINDVMLRPVPAELRRVTLDRGTGLMGHVRLAVAYDRTVNDGFGT